MVPLSYIHTMSTLPATADLQEDARSLDDEVIEMIGTLLAVAAHMLMRVSGIAHLIAAALMMLFVTIITTLARGVMPWPATRLVPIAHRRWLVAAPARWVAP